MRDKEQMKLYVDNVLAINLTKHLVLHGRIEHIKTKYHFLCEQVNLKKLDVLYCWTKD